MWPRRPPREDDGPWLEGLPGLVADAGCVDVERREYPPLMLLCLLQQVSEVQGMDWFSVDWEPSKDGAGGGDYYG